MDHVGRAQRDRWTFIAFNVSDRDEEEREEIIADEYRYYTSKTVGSEEQRSYLSSNSFKNNFSDVQVAMLVFTLDVLLRIVPPEQDHGDTAVQC